MKQFLRHIFLLVAMLVATANAWAQLPYNTVMTESHYKNSAIVIKTEGNVGWNNGVRLGNATGGGFNYDDKYVDIALNTNGIPNVLSATTNGGSTGIDYRVFVSSDNKTYTEFWKSEKKENSISETLPKDTKYIRLFYSGNFAGYFKNIKVTELKYLNSPSSMNLRVGQKILNSTPSTNTITIDWCNVPAISYSIEGTHKDKFSVTKIENNSSVGKYGTATIHLSYIHDDFAGEDQPHTATLKLWSNGTTYDVTLTGVTDRYIADFNWNIANVNANSGEYHVGDYATITDAYTLKNKTTGNAISLPLTFTIKTISRSSIYQEDGDGNYDNDVLSIEDEELKAKNAGVATITASFAGNEEYKPFTKELTLTIKKHEPEFTWNAGNATYYYLSSIQDIFATSNPDCQYTIVSDNEHVAKVIDNTLHIYNVEETANITVTQEENYKWYGKTKTYTITPANPNNHVTFTYTQAMFNDGTITTQKVAGKSCNWDGNGVKLESDATNWDDKFIVIHFAGIPKDISFKYKASNSNVSNGLNQYREADWYIAEGSEGPNGEIMWLENYPWKNLGEDKSNSTDWVTVSNQPLQSTTRYLKLCYSGNFAGYYSDIVVTELEKFEADPNPLDFGPQPVGEGEQLLPLNFSHTNAGRITTATIIGEDAKYFTVTPTVIPGTGRDMSGTTHLNVTFANNGEDRGLTPYEATLVITDNAGNREEVLLTGVRHGKATPEFTWNPNNFPYYFNTSIANIVVSSNTDYANCPLTITSSNENIAKVENGRLYIYDQSGEVTFTVTQRGNDRYNEHTESFTFTPKAKPDLEVPFQVTQPIYGQAITVGDNCSWDGDDHHLKLGDGAWDATKKTAILVFSGRPDKLTFRYATSYNLAVIEIGQTGNPQWEVEESSDGENWKSIWSVRTNSTSWADAEIPLSETTQYVRFSYDGNYAGYFKNINISELVGYKYLRVADGHYLSRGAKWGTQAVVDAFGVVSRISNYTQDNENVYTRFFFVDNEQYMFETETQDDQRLHEVFTDNGTALNTHHLWQINNNGGILTIQSANDVGVSHRGNYITAVNGVLAFTTNEAEATKWQMEDYTEHPQYIADMLNRQAAEAALKDFGEEINTLEKVRNRLKVEDFETLEIAIQSLELGEQTGEGRTIEGMPHIYEQTITGLDTGFYRLTVKALYRISNSEIAWKCNQEKGKESVLAYAYANDVQYPIQSVYASYHSSAIENTDEWRDGKYYSTTLSSANVAFNDANRYLNDVYVYVEADPGKTTGTLRYGIKCPSYVPGAWLAYSTIKLTHFGRKEYVFVGNDSEERTDWQRPGNWDTGTLPGEYHNVRIEADVNIDQPIEVYGISVVEGNKVHITSNGGLTVGKGGVVSAATGTITIDNTPEGAGFLKVHPEAGNKPEKVTVNYENRAYNSGNPRDEIWQYMGAPGSDMQMSDANNTMIYHWNEQQGWLKMSNTDLQPFVGYAFTQNKERTASFEIQATPIIPDKKQEITLTLTQSGMRGSNLFVNSFLAPIDLATFNDEDFTDGVEQTFYLYNSGSWKDWQGEGGASNEMISGVSPGQYYALSPKGASLIDAQYDQTTIPPMQGVYVVTQKDSAKIYLDYAKHVYAAGASNHAMRAPERTSEDFKRVRLQVSSPNSGADRMYVIQHDAATMGYDNGYDAKNMAVASQVSIYTTEADGQMEISVSDNIDSTYIGFNAGADTEYTLRMTSVVGEEMYLKDLDSQTLIPVADDGVYTFSAAANSVNPQRFLLVTRKSDVSTDEAMVQVYVYDNIVHVMQAPYGCNMAVYTIGGQLVAQYALGYAPCSVDLSSLPEGVYVLKIYDKVLKFVCK